MSKHFSIRVPDQLDERVMEYARAKKLNKTEACLSLLERGLMAEADGIYKSELSLAIKHMMELSLTSFTRRIEDELETQQESIDLMLSDTTSRINASYLGVLSLMEGDLSENDDLLSIAGAYMATDLSAEKATTEAKSLLLNVQRKR